jgi:hypothetical protein
MLGGSGMHPPAAVIAAIVLVSVAPGCIPDPEVGGATLEYAPADSSMFLPVGSFYVAWTTATSTGRAIHLVNYDDPLSCSGARHLQDLANVTFDVSAAALAPGSARVVPGPLDPALPGVMVRGGYPVTSGTLVISQARGALTGTFVGNWRAGQIKAWFELVACD